MKKRHDFGLIFWMHLVLIVTQYASPFLFSWKIILAGIVALYLQWFIFGNCVLTMIQFNTKSNDASFNYYYLSKLGFKVNKQVLFWYVGTVFPGLIFVIAIIWQVLLKQATLF